MTTASPVSLGRGRDLGPGPRRAARAVLLTAGLFFGVAAADPFVLIFAVVLILPRRIPLFDLLRAINPTVAAGMLGLGVLVMPMLEGALRVSLAAHREPVPLQPLFAHAAMLVAAWKIQHARLASRDIYFLVAVSFVIVLLGQGGAGSGWALPALVPYVVAVISTLLILHLLNEEQRVLDLARVRGFERDLAEEVAGRGTLTPSTMLTALGMLAVGLVLAGMFIAWLTPLAVEGARVVWRSVGGSGGEDDLPPPEMPEFDDQVPMFEIPPLVTGLRPFGPRLERAEVLARAASDNLAVLMRTVGSSDAPRRNLLRGECYDYLAAGGVWIRARTLATDINAAQDGSAYGKVVLRAPPGERTELEYLVPPGPDRTIYAHVNPTTVAFPVVVTDGVGNLFTRAPRSPRGAYRVVSTEPLPPLTGRLADPGPEFLLLPPDVDRVRAAAFAAPIALAEDSDFSRVEAIREWMQERFLHVDDEAEIPG